MTTTMPDRRRFAVRPDAFYVRHADGVWLRNNIGSFSIRGAGAYDLVAALFANLDGERTVADLCAGLPPEASRSVLRLVETLAGNGFLREVTHPPEPVPDRMAERYAAPLAFLEQHADRPVSRLTHLRSRLVTCVGDGVALRALLGALAEFGFARVRVRTGEESMAELVTELSAGDPGFRWELDADPDAMSRPASGAAAVLLATDRDDVAEVAEAQGRFRAAGVPAGVLGRCGDFVVAVPPSLDRDWCWECVHRCVATRAAGEAAGLPAAAAPATIGALHVVQHTFARLAEVPLDGTDMITSVEPKAPVVRTHTGRRHPRCGRHGAPPAIEPVARAPESGPAEPVRPDIAASNDGAELLAVSDRIVEATTRWIDPVMGPLHAVGEDEHPQLPISASTCLVADPAGTASAPCRKLIVCHAISPREARNQVVLFALEWLARRTLELRGHMREPLAIGAGWTPAEAWYRAHLAASAALPPTSLSWEPVSKQPYAGHPVRDFLADTLAAHGRAWRSTSVERLPTGFVRARVRTDDYEVATGIGVDPEHAVREALLRAVADGGAATAPERTPDATPPGPHGRAGAGTGDGTRDGTADGRSRAGDAGERPAPAGAAQAPALVVAAHLAPPAATWVEATPAAVGSPPDPSPGSSGTAGEAAPTAEPAAVTTATFDLSGLLPFLGDDAVVTAVRLADVVE